MADGFLNELPLIFVLSDVTFKISFLRRSSHFHFQLKSARESARHTLTVEKIQPALWQVNVRQSTV